MKRAAVFGYLGISFLLNFHCVGQKINLQKDSKLVIIENSKLTKAISGSYYPLWFPDDLQLKQIDKILTKAISDQKFFFLKEQSLSELKKNYRQYLCYIESNGDKIVYINSLCELLSVNEEQNRSFSEAWKNELINVSDGGECYWNIKINLNTEMYFDLRINGRS